MAEKLWYNKWPEGIHKIIEYPEEPIFKFIEQSAKKFPDRIAFYFMGFKMSYSELFNRIQRFSNALSNIGIKKGDMVALLLPNCPQFLISYYGALQAGATVTFLSPLHKSHEMEYQLNDSGAETLITLNLRPFFNELNPIKNKTNLKRYILSNLKYYLPGIKKALFPIVRRKELVKIIPDNKQTFDFDELLQKYPPNPPQIDFDVKEDISVLAYTGGTTGKPKGAMLTHYNTVVNITQVMVWLEPMLTTRKLPEKPIPEDYPIKDNNIMACVVPWFHAMGTIAYMNVPMFCAQTIIIFPRFDPVDYLKNIKKYHVVAMGGAPPMYVPILQSPKFPKYKDYFKNVKLCGSGAGPLPVEHLEELKKVVGGLVIEAYGLTECTMGCLFNPAVKSAERKVGSVGIPISDTECKIVDVNSFDEVSLGTEGELWIKGPQNMKGYWNRPEATEETLVEGWLRSGDIAKMDEDGYFFIVDRIKDILKYKGYQVFPREIEELLYQHPAVKEAAVIGKYDKDVGDLPIAFVVLKEGKTATKKELIEYIEKQVAPYKKLRDVVFRKELPVSLAGKVLKRELRDELNK